VETYTTPKQNTQFKERTAFSTKKERIKWICTFLPAISALGEGKKWSRN